MTGECWSDKSWGFFFFLLVATFFCPFFRGSHSCRDDYTTWATWRISNQKTLNKSFFFSSSISTVVSKLREETLMRWWTLEPSCDQSSWTGWNSPRPWPSTCVRYKMVVVLESLKLSIELFRLRLFFSLLFSRCPPIICFLFRIDVDWLVAWHESVKSGGHQKFSPKYSSTVALDNAIFSFLSPFEFNL
jgi:hypothetical protein